MQFIHKYHQRFFIRPTLLVSLLSMGIAIPAGAETRYVSDLITLKMYKDTSLNQGLKPLKSGDKVNVIKRSGGYAQVKTQQGVVGWVKSSYLKKDKPAIVRILDVQEELDALRSKHTDLLIKKTTPPANLDADLQKRVEAAESARQSMEQRLNELEVERNAQISAIRELKNQAGGDDKVKPILLWIILPVLTLITGFFIGYKFLDGKIRTRFGGFNPL